MPDQTRIVFPATKPGTVRTTDGSILHAPPHWILVPPGDAALTRRLKVAGPTWTVQEKKGRKVFSRGVWAPAVNVESTQAALLTERADPAYARKLAAGSRRRDKEQAGYVQTFQESVLVFLAFDPRFAELAVRLAAAVTTHATPVGSGTVARTKRIPVDERAEAAVIAWMRHQTTAYDRMIIPQVKGKRREVRRMLAKRSQSLLEAYRSGHGNDPKTCPLQRSLATTGSSVEGNRM